MFLYFLYFFERVKGEYTQNIVKIIYKTTLEELLSLTLYSLTMNHDFEFFRIFFFFFACHASSLLVRKNYASLVYFKGSNIAMHEM